MRLIRSVLQHAYITSFYQLQELKTSNETLYHVLLRTDHGSSVQCVRGKSFKSASVRSDETSKRRKIGKRMPRNERKLLVETYVNKYREMNAGKFPTAPDTNKNVGGSYYVIKDILEELKYSSKMLHSEKMDTTSPPNNAESMSISQTPNVEVPSNVQQNREISMRNELKRDRSLSEGPLSKDAHAQTESVSTTQTTNDGPSNFQKNSQVLAINERKSGYSLSKGEWTLSTTQVVVDGPTSKAQTLDSISENPQLNEGQQSSILVDKNDEAKLSVSGMPKDAETQSHQFDEQQTIARQQQSDDTSERYSELDKVLSGHTPEKKPSVWQSLKSLTNGFFDMWRR